MNLTLKSALTELRTDGVTLDPVGDLEHILTLDRLSRKIGQAFSPGSDAGLLQPVLRIGNVTLKRISLGAQQFLIDQVMGWIPADMMMQDMAYLFCMAHSPEELWALQHNREDFLKAVKKWIRTVNVPRVELSKAVKTFLEAAEKRDQEEDDQKPTSGHYRRAMRTLARLLPFPETYRDQLETAVTALETEEAEKGTCYSPLIAILVSEYGHTPEHWLWRVTAGEVAILLSALNEKRDKEARSLSGAHDDRMQRAHYEFSSYVEKVRRLKKEAKK